MNKYGFIALTALACAGCRRDMQQQPKYPPLVRSDFYSDGRSARPFPAGTISVDEADVDPAITTGKANGVFLTVIPMPVTAELLARGRERFDIYCSPCHGFTGDGHGMIERRGLKIPADLSSPHVRNAPPGYLYQVIANGFGAMSDYSYQIKNVRDRWAIVAYIRALELSRETSIDNVPPQDRARLEALR